MKENIIKFETAILAKEKGYPQRTGFYGRNTYYIERTGELSGHAFKEKEVIAELKLNSDYEFNHCLEPIVTAMPQSYLQTWLREEHQLYVTALPFRDTEDGVELCWYYSLVEDDEELIDILCNEDDIGASIDSYDSYEDALEEGLKEALNRI
jgi:hypothetical protein